MIKELATEAHEIIVNAKRAYDEGLITREQRDEVIHNLMYDVGLQMEFIHQESGTE